MTEPKTNIKIVLNEDNLDDVHPKIREFEKHNLENNPIHLENGEEGLTYFFGKKSEYLKIKSKLILLDIIIPEISRLKVLRELKIHNITKDTPHVTFTPSDEKKDISKSYNNYAVKPICFPDFSKTIRVIADYWRVINTVIN